MTTFAPLVVDEDDTHDEAAALWPAVARLVRLWGMSCGSSPGAFRVLQVACLGTGSIHAEDLARFDSENHAAAMTVLRAHFILRSIPVPPALRENLERESARIGKLRRGRGNKE